MPPRKLNEDLIELMAFVSPKSRRKKIASTDQIEDKYSEIGDL